LTSDPERVDGVLVQPRAGDALLRLFEEEDFRKHVPGPWKRIGTLRDVGLWRLE
jgi:hypothetical protein